MGSDSTGQTPEADWTPPPHSLAARLQADHVPAWLRAVVHELRSQLGDRTAELADGLSERSEAWSAFDAAVWARLEAETRADAVAVARASADAVPRAKFWRAGLRALRDLLLAPIGSARQTSAKTTLKHLPGRGPAARKARARARAAAALAPFGDCAVAIRMAGDAAGEAAWGAEMAKGGGAWASIADRSRHSGRAAASKNLMRRLFARMDAAAGAPVRVHDDATSEAINLAIRLTGRLAGHMTPVRADWVGAWASDWGWAQFGRGKRLWPAIGRADAAEAALRRAGEAAIAYARAEAARAPRPRPAWRDWPRLWDDLVSVLRYGLTLEDVRLSWALRAARRAGVRQARVHMRGDLAEATKGVRWAPLPAVRVAGWAAWARALADGGEHMILNLPAAELEAERAHVRAAVALTEILVREMDAAAGVDEPAPPTPSEPTEEALEAWIEARQAEAAPVALCAALPEGATREDRVALAERLVAEEKVVEAARRPAVPLQTQEWWCPLAVFGRDIYDEHFCPDDLMPAWLADVVMKLGEGLGKKGQAELCAGLVARARAWPALGAAAWERLEFDLMDAAVESAKASAEAAPRAAPAWLIRLKALRDLALVYDDERRWLARRALYEAGGRRPAAEEARLLARANARVAADNAAARRAPGGAPYHCAWAVKMAGEAAGQAGWGRDVAETGLCRQPRWVYHAAPSQACRALMTRLFERMDAELAARAAAPNA